MSKLERIREKRIVIILWKMWRFIKIVGLMSCLVNTGAMAWLFSELVKNKIWTIKPDAMNIIELPVAIFGVIVILVEIVEHINEERKGVLRRL